MGEGDYEFGLAKYFLFILHNFLHAIKSYNIGPLALLLLQRKACYRFV
jgi:hypothetical protein